MNSYRVNPRNKHFLIISLLFPAFDMTIFFILKVFFPLISETLLFSWLDFFPL